MTGLLVAIGLFGLVCLLGGIIACGKSVCGKGTNDE